jgi:hypothetical protein
VKKYLKIVTKLLLVLPVGWMDGFSRMTIFYERVDGGLLVGDVGHCFLSHSFQQVMTDEKYES